MPGAHLPLLSCACVLWLLRASVSPLVKGTMKDKRFGSLRGHPHLCCLLGSGDNC